MYNLKWLVNFIKVIWCLNQGTVVIEFDKEIMLSSLQEKMDAIFVMLLNEQTFPFKNVELFAKYDEITNTIRRILTDKLKSISKFDSRIKFPGY